MNINDAKQILIKIISAGINTPVMLRGAPGLGKSSIVKSVCSELGLQLVDLRISQLAPTDLRGLPQVTDGIMSFAIPSFYPTEGKGILFLDEFNMATSAVMGICQQLLLDREVGDYKLPDGWTIVAAGNRKEDGCAVNQIPSAVANRLIHIEVEPDLDTWIANFAMGLIDERIISFLKFRPTLFNKPSKTELAYPSPRTWEVANNLLKAGVDIAHTVGHGAAAEFNTFIRVYDSLPDLDAIAKGTKVKMTSKQPDVVIATIVGLSTRITDKKNMISIFEWVHDNLDAEYVSVLFSMSLQVVKKIGIVALATNKKVSKTIAELDELLKSA